MTNWHGKGTHLPVWEVGETESMQKRDLAARADQIGKKQGGDAGRR